MGGGSNTRLIVIRQPRGVRAREYYCRRRDWFAALGNLLNDLFARSILCRNAFHIRLRFAITRHLESRADHRVFARVIAGQSELDVSIKHVEEKSQVASSSFDILGGIKYVRDSEPSRGSRHQLHQAACSLIRPGS